MRTFRRSKREIKSIDDLSKEEQDVLLKAMSEIPCIPFKLRFLKDNYSDQIKMDWDSLTEEDLDTNHWLSYQQILELMLTNPVAINALNIELLMKAVRVKAYRAFVLEPDNLQLEEFRARCELEHKDSLVDPDNDAGQT